MTRRALLRAGAAGAVVVGAGGAAWWALGHGDDPSVPPIDTSAMTELERSVVRVGEHYLAQHGNPSEVQMQHDVPAAVAAAAHDPAAAFEALGGAVTDDCAAGRTVVVDGWVLARSEAAAAGLCTLAARQGRFASQRRG